MRTDSRLAPWQWLVILGALGLTLFPVFWMISTSFKQPPEWVSTTPTWISDQPTFANYVALVDPGRLAAQGQAVGAVSGSSLPALIDSLIIASISTLLSVTIGTLAALAISRYRVGGNFTPFFILAARMFLPIAIAIPVVIMFSSLFLIDTYYGIIIAYTGFTVPFSTWMIKSFLDDVPRELEEAAIMDGLSTLRAHVTVTLPLAVGGIAATTLFIFILNWSEFLFALLLTFSEVTTIPVQISRFHSATAGTLYGPLAAMGTVAVVPLILTGLFIQRYLVRGLTFGAIKR